MYAIIRMTNSYCSLLFKKLDMLRWAVSQLEGATRFHTYSFLFLHKIYLNYSDLLNLSVYKYKVLLEEKSRDGIPYYQDPTIFFSLRIPQWCLTS